MKKHKWFGLMVLWTLSSVDIDAGTSKINFTSPSYLTDSSTKELYVVKSKEDASSTGVSFSTTGATTGNGADVTAWQWYFHNGAPSSSTSSSPGTVTFTNADGQNNACTVGVTHPNPNSSVNCATSSTPVTTIDVIIPKITGVGDDGSGNTQDIWYFSDGAGNSNYLNTISLTLVGITASEAGSVTWSVSGPHNVINFANNQETITGASLTQTIHSVGYSDSENDLTIQVLVKGVTITSGTFTSRAPEISGSFAGDTAVYGPDSIYNSYFDVGYHSKYDFTINDKFGNSMNNGIQFCEWVIEPPGSDYGGENWTEAYLPGNITSYGSFTDTFSHISLPNSSGGYSDVPVTVIPTGSGAGTKVLNFNPQKYMVGGDGNNGAGQTPKGFEADSEFLQLYKGFGRHL